MIAHTKFSESKCGYSLSLSFERWLLKYRRCIYSGCRRLFLKVKINKLIVNGVKTSGLIGVNLKGHPSYAALFDQHKDEPCRQKKSISFSTKSILRNNNLKQILTLPTFNFDEITIFPT